MVYTRSSSFCGVRQGLLPNQRLKLSGCGGRVKGKELVVIAAAAPRSLSAIRYADLSSRVSSTSRVASLLGEADAVPI